MRLNRNWAAFSLLVVGGILVWGCSNNSSPVKSESSVSPDSKSLLQPAVVTSTQEPTEPDEGSEEHGHKPGAHGGVMVSLGRNSYHAEAVFEAGGTLRLYTLGQDETRVIDVEQQKLKGFVKVEGSASAQPFMLEPEPQEGDAEGRTSQFAGTLPSGLQGSKLEVTIPSIVISGERFRLGFTSAAEQHADEMPSKLADEEERQLYLTAGGKYTEADIVANGGVTASVKFKGLKSSHDMFPQTGDKICPVTETKANPDFAWVIGGHRYEFCCPPCVDEFLKAAKTSEEDLKLPADYVKH